MTTTAVINENSYGGGRGSRRKGAPSQSARSLSGKSPGGKPRVRTLLDGRVLVEGRRGPIGRHRVGARASREWPRGEKRKGSLRVAPPAAGGGKYLSLSFSLLPSLPHAWNKCWSCAPHDMPGGPPPSPATITIARYHRESLVPVLVRRHQHHQRYQLSHSPSRFIAIPMASSALLPHRRTLLEIHPPALPCQRPPSAVRFLHCGVPPLRSRASSPFDRSRRLDRSVSLLLSSDDEYTVCPESYESRRIVAQLERNGRGEVRGFLIFSFRWDV